MPSPTTRNVVAVKLPVAQGHGSKKRVSQKLFHDPASVPSAAQPTLKQAQKTIRSKLKASGWTIVPIPRDGHCFFESFVRALKIYRPELQMTMSQLRLACADKMRELKGAVPNLKMFEEDEFGVLLQKKRGHAETKVTLEEYCELLKESLYGGMEEIVLLANMYKLKVTVYDSQNCNGEPQSYLQNSDLPADHPENAGNISG